MKNQQTKQFFLYKTDLEGYTMKDLVFFVFLLFLSQWLSGCGAVFGNSTQYEEEDWYWWATSNQVASMKQDKLALEKMRAQLEDGNISSMGFKGVAKNYYRKVVTISLTRGGENKSYTLAPDEKVVDYLIGGDYYVEMRHKGKVFYEGMLTVPKIHKFQGETYAWLTYAQ